MGAPPRSRTWGCLVASPPLAGLPAAPGGFRPYAIIPFQRIPRTGTVRTGRTRFPHARASGTKSRAGGYGQRSHTNSASAQVGGLAGHPEQWMPGREGGVPLSRRRARSQRRRSACTGSPSLGAMFALILASERRGQDGLGKPRLSCMATEHIQCGFMPTLVQIVRGLSLLILCLTAAIWLVAGVAAASTTASSAGRCAPETIRTGVGPTRMRFVLHGHVTCAAAHRVVHSYFRRVAVEGEGSGGFVTLPSGWTCHSEPGAVTAKTGHIAVCERVGATISTYRQA